MKLSKKSKVDTVISPEKWKCFDGCPVCKILKKAAEEGEEICGRELEEAFEEAESEVEAD